MINAFEACCVIMSVSQSCVIPLKCNVPKTLFFLLGGGEVIVLLAVLEYCTFFRASSVWIWTYIMYFSIFGVVFLFYRRAEKSNFLCWLFPSSPHVQNSHFTGRDMNGESKRPRQSDRWTPRQDPREPTINLSEDGTFLPCPQAKNLGPSVLSSLSAGTKKLATCCTKHV